MNLDGNRGYLNEAISCAQRRERKALDKIANPQPNNWEEEWRDLRDWAQGRRPFSIYAPDPDNNYRLYKAVAEIQRIFGDTKTGWERLSGLPA